MAYRILIADDEEMIRKLVNVTLSRDSRFEITEAADGTEALSMAHETKPDLAILDVRMPGMTGFEVCQALRVEYGDGLAIMMLTAMGQPADVQKGLDSGANEYFIKPFSPASLLSKVYDVLKVAA